MRSEDRQRHILECAKKVFAERGFHAANVSHICAEAGIGRGTLYLYFDSKRAVFEAILRATLDRVQALIRSQRGFPLPRPERLRLSAVLEWNTARLRELLEVVFQDEQTLRILLREAVGLDLGIDQLLGEIDEVVISLLEQDLRAAQQAGIVRPLDPRATATLIVGGVEKLALRALRNPGPVDLDALAREAAHLHAKGILSERIRDE